MTRVRASATNRRPATCGHCGAELAAGRGRVWWDRHGVAHCTCLDPSTCRARLAPPRTSREDLHEAVRVAVEAGALDWGVEYLAARARGELEAEQWTDLSPETEASLRARLPSWSPRGVLCAPTRHAAAPRPAPRPYTPSLVCPPPGPAHRDSMVCPSCGGCGGREDCYSDTLGVQHWQCGECLAAGRPSCWDTCTTCGHRTDDLVAPWVCPGCGRNRRPAPVPATLLARPIPIPGAIILESAEMAEWMAQHPAVVHDGLRGAT